MDGYITKKYVLFNDPNTGEIRLYHGNIVISPYANYVLVHSQTPYADCGDDYCISNKNIISKQDSLLDFPDYLNVYKYI